MSSSMCILLKKYVKLSRFLFWISFCLTVQGCGSESEKQSFSLKKINSQDIGVIYSSSLIGYLPGTFYGTYILENLGQEVIDGVLVTKRIEKFEMKNSLIGSGSLRPIVAWEKEYVIDSNTGSIISLSLKDYFSQEPINCSSSSPSGFPKSVKADEKGSLSLFTCDDGSTLKIRWASEKGESKNLQFKIISEFESENKVTRTDSLIYLINSDGEITSISVLELNSIKN